MWAITVKLLEESIGINLHGLEFGREWILKYDTKSISNKRKIDKLDFIKIKNFCTSNDTLKKVKRQPTEW